MTGGLRTSVCATVTTAEDVVGQGFDAQERPHRIDHVWNNEFDVATTSDDARCQFTVDYTTTTTAVSLAPPTVSIPCYSNTTVYYGIYKRSECIT